MRYLCLSVIILFLSCQRNDAFVKAELKPSKIDSLNTSEKVEDFVRSIDSSLIKFTLKNIQDFNRYYKSDSIAKVIAEKMNVDKSYYKADFDNNGYQDLLAIGDSHTCSSTAMEGSCSFDCFVVMNFGRDSIKLIDFFRAHNRMIVPEIISKRGMPLLKIVSPETFTIRDNEVFKDSSSAVLTYKFDNFIEYNKRPANYNIESIEFSTSGCFGTCPVYKLTIDNNRSATFLAEYFNFNRERENYVYEQNEGFFTGKIKDDDYNKLVETLNYIDFKNLADNYSVMHTDDQTATLKITYDNGKVKNINDYGMIGTYGLTAVYHQLADLRFSQEWQKAKEAVSKK